jgi:hypothetical protein
VGIQNPLVRKKHEGIFLGTGEWCQEWDLDSMFGVAQSLNRD